MNRDSPSYGKQEGGGPTGIWGITLSSTLSGPVVYIDHTTLISLHSRELSVRKIHGKELSSNESTSTIATSKPEIESVSVGDRSRHSPLSTMYPIEEKCSVAIRDYHLQYKHQMSPVENLSSQDTCINAQTLVSDKCTKCSKDLLLGTTDKQDQTEKRILWEMGECLIPLHKPSSTNNHIRSMERNILTEAILTQMSTKELTDLLDIMQSQITSELG